MLVRKLIFSTQIILFFDKEFKKFIINPYFYQHLFSSLQVITLYVHGSLKIDLLVKLNAHQNLKSEAGASD